MVSSVTAQLSSRPTWNISISLWHVALDRNTHCKLRLYICICIYYVYNLMQMYWYIKVWTWFTMIIEHTYTDGAYMLRKTGAFTPFSWMARFPPRWFRRVQRPVQARQGMPRACQIDLGFSKNWQHSIYTALFHTMRVTARFGGSLFQTNPL